MTPLDLGFEAGGVELAHSLTPHPDIELGFARTRLDYFVTMPRAAINAETGVLLVIPGYGERADMPYYRDKLRPYLADTYNCLAVGVNYYGSKLRMAPESSWQHSLANPETFIESADRLFGIPPHACTRNGELNLNRLAEAMRQRGINRAPAEFRLFRTISDPDQEYESFGLLPALDHLTVLADVMRRYPVNPRRLAAFGTSYGGYVGLLLGKLAPHTFSLIVDNSGFVVTRIQEIESFHVRGPAGHLSLAGVEFPFLIASPWTVFDELSPQYFSDGHRRLRSLLEARHLGETRTRYHVFHSDADTIVPIAHKDALVTMLQQKGIEVHYRRVGESDLYGRLFKTLENGMRASLRGLFDAAAAKDGRDLAKADADTDFHRESDLTFDCGSMTYHLCYSAAPSLQATLGR